MLLPLVAIVVAFVTVANGAAGVPALVSLPSAASTNQNPAVDSYAPMSGAPPRLRGAPSRSVAGRLVAVALPALMQGEPGWRQRLPVAAFTNSGSVLILPVPGQPPCTSE